MPIFELAGAIFFFQAEDGIRDVAVTGVQTCALPIYDLQEDLRGARVVRLAEPENRLLAELLVRLGLGDLDQGVRSEEHTSELQSRLHLVCRLLLEKKKCTISITYVLPCLCVYSPRAA